MKLFGNIVADCIMPAGNARVELLIRLRDFCTGSMNFVMDNHCYNHKRHTLPNSSPSYDVSAAYVYLFPDDEKQPQHPAQGWGPLDTEEASALIAWRVAESAILFAPPPEDLGCLVGVSPLIFSAKKDGLVGSNQFASSAALWDHHMNVDEWMTTQERKIMGERYNKESP